MFGPINKWTKRDLSLLCPLKFIVGNNNIKEVPWTSQRVKQIIHSCSTGQHSGVFGPVVILKMLQHGTASFIKIQSVFFVSHEPTNKQTNGGVRASRPIPEAKSDLILGSNYGITPTSQTDSSGEVEESVPQCTEVPVLSKYFYNSRLTLYHGNMLIYL